MVKWKHLQRNLEKELKNFSREINTHIDVSFSDMKDFCDFSTPLVKENIYYFIVGTRIDIKTNTCKEKNDEVKPDDHFDFLKGKNHDINHLKLIVNLYESSTDPLVTEMAIEQLSNYSQVKFAEFNYPNMMYEAYCDKMAWIKTVEEFKQFYNSPDYNAFVLEKFNDMIFEPGTFSFIDPNNFLDENGKTTIERATNISQIAEYFDKYSPLNLDYSKEYNISEITKLRQDSIKLRCDEHTGGPELLERLSEIKDPRQFNRELLAMNLAIDDDPRFFTDVGRGSNLKNDFYNHFKCIPLEVKQDIIDRANEICHLLRKDYRLENVIERNREVSPAEEPIETNPWIPTEEDLLAYLDFDSDSLYPEENKKPEEEPEPDIGGRF